MTMHCHVVVADLFLPSDIAGEACAGLDLTALEWLLARAQAAPLPVDTLEAWLCHAFGVGNQAIAPVTLQADGIEPGQYYWLRADPVHIQMQRDKMILRPEVALAADEAAQLCASLNGHFADQGLHFFAPHPQRWYLSLDSVPDIVTRTLAQVAGRNVHRHLPQGADALRWHQIFNEIQMLFYDHAVNVARAERGELPINSVWFWGGGQATTELSRPFTKIIADSPLAAAFAQAAGIPCMALPDELQPDRAGQNENLLIVWDGLRRSLQQGELHTWRDSVLRLERSCVALKRALRNGRLSQLTLDVLNAGDGRSFVLTRAASWKLWCMAKPLAHYARAAE